MVGLGLWVLSAVAIAATPKTLAIASGDCRDVQLGAGMSAFQPAISQRAGAELFNPEAVLEKLKPLPTSSVEDIGRVLDTAQTQFYGGQFDKALENVRDALSAIARLSPRAQPWALATRAHVLESLVFKSLNKKNESAESFRRILRVDPKFQLDADLYTPSTLQALDAIRKEVTKAKKVKLSVTSAPSGAEVFLDGAKVGQTPLSLDVLPGNYALALTRGELASFARTLKLNSDDAVQVDLAFEGALSPQLPLCVSGPASTALKLAALVGAETAIILTLESRNNEPGWATAVILEVNRGTRVRDGGVRAAGTPDQRKAALEALATFVLTGQAVPPMVPVAAADAPMAVNTSPDPGAADVQVQAVAPGPRGYGPRIASIVLMGAGVATVAAGIGILVSVGGDRQALGQLTSTDGKIINPANTGTAKELSSRIDTSSTVSTILLATGTGVALAGLGAFAFFPPETTPAVSVFPGGASASLAGTF